jgi:hypothetical protein
MWAMLSHFFRTRNAPTGKVRTKQGVVQSWLAGTLTKSVSPCHSISASRSEKRRTLHTAFVACALAFITSLQMVGCDYALAGDLVPYTEDEVDALHRKTAELAQKLIYAA